MTDTIVKPEGQAIEQRKPTISERFMQDVEKQFLAEMGDGPKFSAFQKKLVQHMYLKVDASLKAQEDKRQQKGRGGTEYAWNTVDRQKLALDTVHIVSLGLDPLISNHVHPVFYFNGRKEKYDVQLQVGYMGRDYIARQHAVEPPIAITYELVYDSDNFKALPRSSEREVEGYEFEITKPFDRGTIIGGFGYIQYADPKKNRLVLVTQRDFKRSQGASKSDFWQKNDVEMHLKTVYHRVASKVQLDPAKVNSAAFAALSTDDPMTAEEEVDEEARTNANREVMDFDDERTIDAEPVGSSTPDPQPSSSDAARPPQGSEQPSVEFPEEPGF